MDHDVLNFKDKFDYVLRDDEQVLWTGDVNKNAYVKKVWRSFLLFCLVPGFGWATFIIMLVFAPFSIPLICEYADKAANNTFVCITDKQILIRKGVFKTDIVRIPHSSIGTVNLVTSIFDSEDEVKSSNLVISLKYQMSASEVMKVTISSLNYVDEAYKILSKLSDNEALKVQNN